MAGLHLGKWLWPSGNKVCLGGSEGRRKECWFWVLVHEAKTVPHPRLILTYSLVTVINKLLLGKKKNGLQVLTNGEPYRVDPLADCYKTQWGYS